MTTRNSKYNKKRTGTVRRRKSSTAGKILLPLDVRSSSHLKDFENRIKTGPLTIVLVYADWCGHCHTIMPHFDAAAKSPSRSIQAVKVNERMLPEVNAAVNKRINNAAKPISVDGYPSIILIDNKGNKVTDVDTVKNTATLTKVMNKAGPLSNQAGLTNSSVLHNADENVENISLNNNVNEELQGNIVSTASKNKVLSNAEEITSMISPITPPDTSNNVDLESISNTLTPAQKIGGGCGCGMFNKRNGGSLYSAMARTAYTLAPTAILLGTASMILKKNKRHKYKNTKKNTKKHTKKHMKKHMKKHTKKHMKRRN